MPQSDIARTEVASSARLRWWTELPLILVVYALYSAGRLLVRGDVSTAVDHGLGLLRVEKALWLNLEHPLNRLFTREPWLGIPADFWYASLHYLVTPVILVWLFRARTRFYRAARTWLMTSTLIGLVGFSLLPTCPPRLLAPVHGFVDTMAHYSSYGWWGGEASAPRGLGGMTNQYAAMPSLHVGWALWCGVMLWRYGGTRAARVAAVAYPLITTIVVMGTANHYFLDAVAGAAVMGVGLLLTPLVMGRADRLWAWLRVRFEGRSDDRFGEVPAGRTEGRSGDRSGGRSEGGFGGRSTERLTPVADASPGTLTPIVSGGCQTSTGERIPRQRKSEAEPGAAPTDAGDGAPAATR
ncbi:phosphatase PAP2 family protein [Streptomyces phyllanthi]|uniref:Phosphatase PAP2 family protein n=1 Tax=Streptomyces phyllanthi TaxID=1803180 RepID=A0A5N8W4A3_9ACTN|nr:phosphatase PAP2 family protein [Streptomyces phyllanthi]MPY42317.1 phosphatase PAP2 family protein [Streptomyces phyllanthi]